MRLLTGNDLVTGQVTWWTGAGWSIHVDDAVDAGAHAETVLAVEQATLRVNGAYVVEAGLADGRIRPLHIKERIRAAGPTVRPDLAIQPARAEDREWVI